MKGRGPCTNICELLCLQKLLPGLKAAEEQKDDLKACPLQWMYCHMMLLTGSRPDQVITVSDFLKHVKKVCALICL